MVDTEATISLADLGERRIYDEVIEPRYRDVPSFGDDCADFGHGLVVTTDSCPTPLLERIGERDLYYSGWLLATINLSDLAAAGALPEGLVVNYTLPSETSVGDLKRIIEGVDACAKFHGTRVLGGDIRDGKVRQLSATAIGRTLPRNFMRGRWSSGKLSRRGARAKDALILVGNPGYLWGAALVSRGHADVPVDVRLQILERARRPVAQLKAARLLARHGLAKAAIDVSDGLFAAVRLLAAANGLGAVMEPEIELDDVLKDVCEKSGVSSLQLGQNWGDWCLLVAVGHRQAAYALRALRKRNLSARRVGTLTSDPEKLLVRSENGPMAWQGIDQERFTARSWQGDGIDAHISWMKEQSQAVGRT
ncbi:thiamine-phosphate kinase [Pseudonocardia alaniniphila]|uniref:Thiamine-phosphate kinase n=1 Tax=Pseudonocardia alaniniphila TaxID=75291 RepID=A0ABS9TQE8_9PSEU|nr:thiamine-phosphate kinase [Pseudonocardia alaniniphila]MCH6170769.1 thiamine-phosphate kinase [Pseudonocardia alaniniphila]